MELEASDFSRSLLTREDSTEWTKEWAELSQGFQSRATDKGLSPEGRAAFRSRFTDWNTRRTIHLETLAANKTLELSKQRGENALNVFMETQNYDGGRELLHGLQSAGVLSTPDLEAKLFEIDRIQQHNQTLETIRTNPRAWLDSNPNPAPGYDETKHQQLLSFARQQARLSDQEALDGVLDGIISNHVTTPEQIQDLTPHLRPADRAKLNSALERWNAQAQEREQNKPETIQKNVGEFYSLLSDYNPDDESLDEHRIKLGILAQSVPEGPLRDQMRRSLNARRARLSDEAATASKAAKESVISAFKADRFGPSKLPDAPAISLNAALEKGWLKDSKKLQDAGFAPGTAKTIAIFARSKGNAAAAKLFKDQWKDRPNAANNLSPFDRAVADALRLENPFLQWKGDPNPEDLEAHNKALNGLGKALIDIDEWLQRNPRATDKEIAEKVGTIAGAEARRQTTTLLTAPRPTRPDPLPFAPELPDWQEQEIDNSMLDDDSMLLPPLTD
jgi:hypothetical protein